MIFTVLFHRLRTLACLLPLLLAGGHLARADGTPRFEQITSFARSPMTPSRAGIANLGGSSSFYFAASEGGTFNCGSIMRSNGGTITTVTSFTGRTGASKGDSPSGAMAVVTGASTIYGVTTRGGVDDAGVVYRFNPGLGTAVTVLQFGNFVSGGSYTLGRNPTIGLTLDGNGMLWGISGGSPAVVYKVNPNTAQAAAVTTISPTTDAHLGLTPRGELTYDGVDSLWGVTEDGGTGFGLIYKIHQNTGVVTVVTTLTGAIGAAPCKGPTGSLVREGSTGNLLGLSQPLGPGVNAGRVFRVKVSDGTFTVAGTLPYSSSLSSVKEGLVDMQNGTFGGIGLSTGGGFGCVFTWKSATPSSVQFVYPFILITRTSKGADPVSLISPAAGLLTGCVTAGGAYERGGVFSVQGTTLTLFPLPTVTEENIIGSVPGGGLVEGVDGELWGLLQYGGIYGFSTIGAGGAYSFKPTGNKVTMTAVLPASATLGRRPVGELVRYAEEPWHQETLVGQTSSGNASAAGGTIFSFPDSSNPYETVAQVSLLTDLQTRTPNAGLIHRYYNERWSAAGNKVYSAYIGAGGVQDLVTLTGKDGPYFGSEASSRLYLDSLGVVWGVTAKGGPQDSGTIYKLEGHTFTSVVQFTGAGGSAPGSRPNGALTAGVFPFLWGTSAEGGPGGKGTVFKLNRVTGALSTVAAFGAGPGLSAGATPKCGLTMDRQGWLWGTTSAGGAEERGTIFRMNPATDLLETMFEFTGSAGPVPGTGPASPLVVHSDGNLYGTTPGLSRTSSSVPAAGGNVFRIRFGQGLQVAWHSEPLIDGLNLSKNSGLTEELQNVYLGDNKKTVSLELTNLGANPVTGLTFDLSGDVPADYKVAGPLPATLAPGQTVTFDVVFEPKDLGMRYAVLTIGSGNPDTDAFVLSLLGTSIKRSVGFESTAIGVPEDGSAFPINVYLDAPLSEALKIPFTVDPGSSSAADFTVTASPLVIPAGGTTATIWVTARNDRLFEPYEAFNITLGTPSLALVELSSEPGRATCAVQIQDNDDMPYIYDGVGGVITPGQPLLVTANMDNHNTVPFTGVWRHDGRVIPGATQLHFRKEHATLADAGTYQYTLKTNAGAFVVSPLIEVWVIDNRQKSVGVAQGRTATLSFAAAGRSLSYFWTRTGDDGQVIPINNGGRISGATTTTLKIAQVTVEDTGPYQCHYTIDGYESGAVDFTLVVPNSEVKVEFIEFPSAMVGQQFDFQVPYRLIEAGPANGPSHVSAAGLPPGLVCNSVTGAISGIPARAGRYKVTVTMSNSFNRSSGSAFLEVAPLPSFLPGMYTAQMSPTYDSAAGGRLDFSVSASGVMTGTLRTGQERRSFASRVVLPEGPDMGTCHIEIRPPSNSSTAAWWWIDLFLRPDFVVEGYSSRYHGHGWDSGSIAGWRSPWGGEDKPLTIVHPHHNFAVLAPDCRGNGALTIGASGATVVSGRLVDGQAFATTSLLASDLRFAIFQAMYGGKGGLACIGIIQPHYTETDFDVIDDASAGAYSLWSIPLRPATSRIARSPEFNNMSRGVSLQGGSYGKPPAGECLLALEPVNQGEYNAKFRFVIDSSIVSQPPDVAFRLGVDHVARLPKPGFSENPGRVRDVTFNVAAGTFSGLFTVDYGTANARSARFSGRIIPGARQGVGCFLIPNVADPLVSPAVTVRNSALMPGTVIFEPISP